MPGVGEQGQAARPETHGGLDQHENAGREQGEDQRANRGSRRAVTMAVMAMTVMAMTVMTVPMMAVMPITGVVTLVGMALARGVTDVDRADADVVSIGNSWSTRMFEDDSRTIAGIRR